MTGTQSSKGHPFILGKTLGKAMGSVHLACPLGYVAGRTQILPGKMPRERASTGPTLGEDIFSRLSTTPKASGWEKNRSGNNFAEIKTEDKKINLHIPELLDELKALDVANEEAALVMDTKFPLILMAGTAYVHKRQPLMRDPAWNEGKRVCTLAMHPNDAASLKLTDGQQVRVITEAGSEEIELEVSDTAHIGHVVIPHGFGLVYNGRKYGANVNRLTKNTHRDQFGTPIHSICPLPGGGNLINI